LTITAPGLTAATFVADLQAATNPGGNPVTPAAFFAADVLNTNNGATASLTLVRLCLAR